MQFQIDRVDGCVDDGTEGVEGDAMVSGPEKVTPLLSFEILKPGDIFKSIRTQNPKHPSTQLHYTMSLSLGTISTFDTIRV
jgi:hypothetical protein